MGSGLTLVFNPERGYAWTGLTTSKYCTTLNTGDIAYIMTFLITDFTFNDFTYNSKEKNMCEILQLFVLEVKS